MPANVRVYYDGPSEFLISNPALAAGGTDDEWAFALVSSDQLPSARVPFVECSYDTREELVEALEELSRQAGSIAESIKSNSLAALIRTPHE